MKNKRNKASYHIINCIYTKNKHNYVSECGHRALNVRDWNFCPWCGKRISKLWNVKNDEEVAD